MKLYRARLKQLEYRARLAELDTAVLDAPNAVSYPSHLVYHFFYCHSSYDVNNKLAVPALRAGTAR